MNVRWVCCVGAGAAMSLAGCNKAPCEDINVVILATTAGGDPVVGAETVMILDGGTPNETTIVCPGDGNSYTCALPEEGDWVVYVTATFDPAAGDVVFQPYGWTIDVTLPEEQEDCEAPVVTHNAVLQPGGGD